MIEAFVTGIQDRDGFRKLGQYSVNIYPEHLKALWDSGCLEQIGGSGFVLRDLNRYSRETGLQMDVDTGYGVFV